MLTYTFKKVKSTDELHFGFHSNIIFLVLSTWVLLNSKLAGERCVVVKGTQD
jgi:hypothetical protein